jgi:CDP-glucose 4,6-dehydratase
VADMFCKAWGDNLSWYGDSRPSYHEAHNLSLDITKAKKILDWSPKWSLSNAIDKTVEWHKAQMSGKNMLEMSVNQIKEFLKE